MFAALFFENISLVVCSFIVAIRKTVIQCLRCDLFHRIFFTNLSSSSSSQRRTKTILIQFLILMCFRAALFESNIKCRYNCVNFDKSRRKNIHFLLHSLFVVCLFLYALQSLFVYHFFAVERRSTKFYSRFCFHLQSSFVET